MPDRPASPAFCVTSDEPALSGIAEQPVLAHRRDEDVGQAVVIVVPHRDAHRVHLHRQPRGRRDVRERAVPVVPIEPQRASAGACAPASRTRSPAGCRATRRRRNRGTRIPDPSSRADTSRRMRRCCGGNRARPLRVTSVSRKPGPGRRRARAARAPRAADSGASSDAHQPVADRVHHQLRRVVDVQRLHDIRAVNRHRVGADASASPRCPCSTCRSRSVAALPVRAPKASARRFAASPRRQCQTRIEHRAAPRPPFFTACTSSRSIAFFSRYPRAPASRQLRT